MRFFLIFKVHGAGCPAGRAGLQKDDAIILVNEKDVISLKHNEFVQLIKSLSVMKLTMVVERFVHNYFTIVEFQALSFLTLNRVSYNFSQFCERCWH